MMPNLPAMYGKGVVAVLSDAKLDFLDCLGSIVYVQSFHEINRFIGFTGSGTGFVYHTLLEYKKAATEIGISQGIDN